MYVKLNVNTKYFILKYFVILITQLVVICPTNTSKRVRFIKIVYFIFPIN